jgi:hypothetical protein
MLTGTSPFVMGRDTSLEEQFRQLMTTDIPFPPTLSAPAKELLTRLLVKSVRHKQPTKRLRDIAVIKQHPFFERINWARLKNLKVPAPAEVRVDDITREDFVLDHAEPEESFSNVVMSDERKKAMRVINFTFIRNDLAQTPLLKGSTDSLSSPTKSEDSSKAEGDSSRLTIE